MNELSKRIKEISLDNTETISNYLEAINKFQTLLKRGWAEKRRVNDLLYDDSIFTYQGRNNISLKTYVD